MYKNAWKQKRKMLLQGDILSFRSASWKHNMYAKNDF